MLTAERAAGAFLVLIGAVALWEGLRFPVGSLWRPGPAFLPAVLSTLLIVIGLVLIAAGGGGRRITEVGWHEWRHAVGLLGVCVFIALTLERLGWRLTVAVSLLFILLVMERRGLVSGLVLTLVIALGSFYLFSDVLQVPLPRGPFGF